MPKVSVTVITKNEAEHIAAAVFALTGGELALTRLLLGGRAIAAHYVGLGMRVRSVARLGGWERWLLVRR